MNGYITLQNNTANLNIKYVAKQCLQKTTAICVTKSSQVKSRKKTVIIVKFEIYQLLTLLLLHGINCIY